jgi:hypothetical protein
MLPLSEISRWKVAVVGAAAVATSLALPCQMQAGAFTAGPVPMATVAEIDRSANPLNQLENPQPFEVASDTSNSAGAAAAGMRFSTNQQQMLISGHDVANSGADITGGISRRRRAVSNAGGMGGPSSGGGSGGSSSGGSAVAATGPVAGSTAANPILPSGMKNGAYVFNHNGTSAGTPIFFDPPIASGYVFTASGPNFASFTVTTPLPNTPVLTFTFNGGSTNWNTSGSGLFPEFSFPNGGVSQFVLSGINNADIHGQEFNYAFTFVGTDAGSFTQAPLSFPEPSSLVLLSMGVAGIVIWQKRGAARA